MVRVIYSLLFYLAQPLVWLRLAWRGRKQPEYLQHLGERYGRHDLARPERLLWLHAVSVGETRAAEPLIKALLDEYPDHSVLMTHMTPTGRAVGGELIGKLGPRLIQAYLPYDLPDACVRFLDHFKPRLGLLMETEIWPNLIATATRRQIPMLLVNARLSAKSQKSYQRFLPLIRPALEKLGGVAAQTGADGERLKSIGAGHVRVTGNLKFDVSPAPEKLQCGTEWRRTLGNHPVWLAACQATAAGSAPGAPTLLREEHLINTRQIVVASRNLAQSDPRFVFARHHWRTDNHLAALGLIEAGLGWGWQPRALVQPRIAAGSLVEMPFENLSNGVALWVDVVWSKERPLGLGARRFVQLIAQQGESGAAA